MQKIKALYYLCNEKNKETSRTQQPVNDLIHLSSIHRACLIKELQLYRSGLQRVAYIMQRWHSIANLFLVMVVNQ